MLFSLSDSQMIAEKITDCPRLIAEYESAPQ